MATETTAVAIRPSAEVRRELYERNGVIWASAGADVKTPEVRKALAGLGDFYGLDPTMGEIMLIGGKAYVTLNGYISITQRHPAFDGIELFPLTMADREAMMIDKTDHAWKAVIHRTDKRYPFVQYGRANQKNTKLSGQQGYDFLMEQAQCRAIRRAAKLAFNLNLPEPPTDGEIEQGLPVLVESRDVHDVPPLPPGPDWPRFWVLTKDLGATADEVHQALGVESVKQWQGSLDDAITTVERFVKQRDQAEPTFDETFPPNAPAAPIKPIASANRMPTDTGLATPAQVRAIYQSGRTNHGFDEALTIEESVQQFGVAPAELTRQQAAELIRYLQAKR